MSLTWRPSRPPLTLTSSAQMVIASSADFPVPASGPVSAMPKPIFRGSSAAAGRLVAAMLSAASVASTAVRKPPAPVARVRRCIIGETSHGSGIGLICCLTVQLAEFGLEDLAIIVFRQDFEKHIVAGPLEGRGGGGARGVQVFRAG